ncbi:class I SAM-dependent methyltransferase [Opitutus sp. ER46]|uniref:class I SAM-dependent methyltransferase n=1 Tax=Opitutus sp. ER46 TaxID=2161864 RepID=UPI000D324621|nr:class I SAM-dependent methyltransferase [Opitutus sp. ER46]PTX92507.1 class I SAM-dependent methyltransferase [Opitutus sp. ER46]
MKPDFDPLARSYRTLEFLAFGADLERVRFCQLHRLAGARRILVLGEGDGRCLARLLEIAPDATIDCVDLSAAMLRRAEARLSAEARRRVTFSCADARTVALRRSGYDGVVTFFFLDCLLPEEMSALVSRLAQHLAPGGLWLWGDFNLPASGWRRWRATAWLTLLYAFFRWQTGLRVRQLPDAEAALTAAGLHVEASRSFQHGLLRSAVYRAPR